LPGTAAAAYERCLAVDVAPSLQTSRLHPAVVAALNVQRDAAHNYILLLRAAGEPAHALTLAARYLSYD
jgi:hypothetical protein